jgi:hypothetical protein
MASKRKRDASKDSAAPQPKPRAAVAEDFFAPIPKDPTSVLKRDCSPVEAIRWDSVRAMETEARNKILASYGLELKSSHTAGQDAARIVTEERARASRGDVVAPATVDVVAPATVVAPPHHRGSCRSQSFRP